MNEPKRRRHHRFPQYKRDNQAELDTVDFIPSSMHVSQLVYKGQAQVFCLQTTCAQYKEVKVKTQFK